MTDQELRIRVAELAGWEQGPTHSIKLGVFGTATPMTLWHRKGEKDNWQDDPPDFPNDLNAMHEAETLITTFDQRQHYQFAMFDILSIAKLREARVSEVDTNWLFYHATARQRAEAFVKVMETV